MSASTDVDSWRKVESRQGFAAYLLFLAADCEQACTAQDPHSAAAERWPHRGIDSFLWGWVRLLGRRIEGADLLHERAPGRPGWQGLAYQLDTVRTTPQGVDRELGESDITSDEVVTVRDLRMYVAALATDFARDQREYQAKFSRGEWAGDGGSWAHGVLYNWLDAWAAWVDDTRLDGELEPVTWQSVALQLSAAQIYE